MTKAFASAVLCVFTFVAATGVARASATPAQKCASSKIKEMGKKANGKLTCWSKEVVRPGSLAACTAAVEGKFADRFARAEGKGGCGTTGDAGPIEAKVDAFVDDVVTALTGSPPGVILGTDDAKRCASAKLRAAGRKTASKTECYSEAATTRTLDPLCLSAAEARFGQKWGATEAKGGCATSGDQATIEGKVDAFVNVCGDGIIAPGETCDPPGQQGSCPTGESCNADCTGCQTVCGDGIIGSGETCDPPGQQGSCPTGESCNADCTGCQTVCGDGIIGSGETCDPPGQQGSCPTGESCNADCTGCQTVCGDGIIAPGETCDPPGSQSTCDVGVICNSTCSGCEPNCGDRCQTGPAMSLACGACVTSVCGSHADCCNVSWDSTCVILSEFLCGRCPYCGDGSIDPGETCDPPGRQGICGAGQICSNSCLCADCPTSTAIPPAGGTFSGSTIGGSNLLDSSCGGPFSPERTFSWTPAVSGTATIRTCGGATVGPRVLYIRAGTCSGSELACDWCQITPSVTAGQTYIIVVDGVEYDDVGNFTLTVTAP
jgi:hypothetical protein